ncbi:hypothetical protein BH09ACT5_BH09ACT5_00120 [soil metagenome]
MLHGTQVKTVEIDASPDAAFRTMSRPDLWVRLPGGEPSVLDFRVGGSFAASGTFHQPGRPVERVEVRYGYLVIAPPELVYTSELRVNGVVLSVSLITMAFADGLLTLTEQYVFLDSPDAEAGVREREGGTRLMLYGLKAAAEG